MFAMVEKSWWAGSDKGILCLLWQNMWRASQEKESNDGQEKNQRSTQRTGEGWRWWSARRFPPHGKIGAFPSATITWLRPIALDMEPYNISLPLSVLVSCLLWAQQYWPDLFAAGHRSTNFCVLLSSSRVKYCSLFFSSLVSKAWALSLDLPAPPPHPRGIIASAAHALVALLCVFHFSLNFLICWHRPESNHLDSHKQDPY